MASPIPCPSVVIMPSLFSPSVGFAASAWIATSLPAIRQLTLTFLVASIIITLTSFVTVRLILFIRQYL